MLLDTACSYVPRERGSIRLHRTGSYPLFARASADRSTNQSILSTANPLGGDSLSHPTAWRSCLSLYIYISWKGYSTDCRYVTRHIFWREWISVDFVWSLSTPDSTFPSHTHQTKKKWEKIFMSRAQIRFGIHRNFSFFCCYRADFFHLQTPSSLMCSSSTYYFRLVRACNTPESTALEVVLL